MEPVAGIEPASSDYKTEVLAVELYWQVARVLGIEPRLRGLEALVLPNYTTPVG
jgi:hypothetical protein